MFSSRFPPRLTTNALARARAAATQRGDLVDDLTESNPTMVGLTIAPDALVALADPRGVQYRPDPLGLLETRRAIAEAIDQSINRTIDQSGSPILNRQS